MNEETDTFVERENSSDDYEARENLWDEQWPGGDGAEVVHIAAEPDNLDEELPFPDVVGTRDSIEAVRDAEPYVPPTDPPVLPGGREGITMATGFGTSPDEEAAEDEPLRNDLDIEDEVTLLLRQDSLTSRYNLGADVDNGVVHIRGRVASIDDAEHALSIVGELPGLVDIVDDMTIDPAAGE
jgi:hypothetical protein